MYHKALNEIEFLNKKVEIIKDKIKENFLQSLEEFDDSRITKVGKILAVINYKDLTTWDVGYDAQRTFLKRYIETLSFYDLKQFIAELQKFLDSGKTDKTIQRFIANYNSYGERYGTIWKSCTLTRKYISGVMKLFNKKMEKIEF